MYRVVGSNHVPKRPSIATHTRLVWSNPRVGWLKINFDGNFLPHSGEESAGIVARDEQGSVLFTASRIMRKMQRCRGS